MQTIEVLNLLTESAKVYRENAKETVLKNSHMNELSDEKISQEQIDAILVDFINFSKKYE